jgi:protoheme IX farnesyltransferase
VDTVTRIQWLRRLSVVVVVMTFALMVLGAWVKATGSGLACPDWPKCYGEWLPPFPSADNDGVYQGEPVGYPQDMILYEWFHRFVASLLGPILLAYAWIAWRGKELAPGMRLLPAVAGGVLVIQILLGALTVLQKNEAWASTLHLATATLFFFLVTVSAMFSWLRPRPGAGIVVRQAEAPPVAYPGEFDARGMRHVVQDYVEISKPRIMLLLLVVAWAAMFLASRGLPPLDAFVTVTLAGIFSTAASGAFNNVWERERDANMRRTAGRAVAAGRIPVRHAVFYGAILTVLAVASLALIKAWLAAALTMGAVAYYVLVYTAWLKPTTAQSIVIGGLAGSFPALIGWAAVTRSIGLEALIIALLVFLWTPAHFWALALLYKSDYAAADYPMLPNTAGEDATRRQILLYSVLTVLCSLVFVYPLRQAGIVYIAAAVGLGALLVQRAAEMETRPTPQRYRSFFLYSIQYLGVLLLALIADQVWHLAVFE